MLKVDDNVVNHPLPSVFAEIEAPPYDVKSFSLDFEGWPGSVGFPCLELSPETGERRMATQATLYEEEGRYNKCVQSRGEGLSA